MLSYIISEKISENKKKSNAALQVCNKICKRAYLKASLTIEASLSFTIFMFAMSILMMPFEMMNTNRKILGISEAICRDASQYAYTLYRLKKGYIDTNDAIDEIAPYMSGIGIGFYASQVVKEKVDDKNIQNISGVLSECMSDGENIIIRLSYDYIPTLNIFPGLSLKQEVVSVKRAWIGDGNLEDEEKNEEKEEDDIVYIGKNPTRYHLYSTCHYLYNDIKSVNLSSIENERNINGAKYKPCDRCGSGARGSVYIMRSGTKYHSTKKCSAIGAYVKSVNKSEVEHLGACSYCGGGK